MNYFAARTAPAWSQPNPKSTRKPSGRIEIRLSAQPPRYSQGDGPPTAPLGIVLPNDSTARIFDKRVMQGPPKNGELSLQLYYIVGWTDLPAARVAIQAQYIYDYVPPRVLEDFEYQLYLDREAREEAEEAAAALEAVRQMVEADSIAQPKAKGVSVLKSGSGRKRRKRQRPSKADLIAKEQAEATSFDQAEAAHASVAAETTSGPSLGGVPSLSTPKKKSIPQTYVIANSEDDVVVEDEMDLDNDVAIQRQLLEETTDTRDTSVSDDIRLVPSNDPHALPEVTPKSFYGATKPTDVQSVPRPTYPQKSTLQHYGFTPAARSKSSWPGLETTSTSEASTPIKTEIPRPSESKLAHVGAEKKKKKGKKPKLVEPEEKEETTEPVYEVKRLEGMRYEEIEGQVVRVFKVRWKGNWPPEDNPTWEPEENITPKLVEKYLAKRKEAGHEPTPFVLPTTTTPHLKRKWSSVAEAFMGDPEEQEQNRPSSSGHQSASGSSAGNDLVQSQGVVEDDEGTSENELLQVTEDSQAATPYRSKEFNDALRKELEKSFRRQSIRRSSDDLSS